MKKITVIEYRKCPLLGATILALAAFLIASAASAAVGPSATTDTATYLSDTVMYLNGTINPENAATNVWFKWGPTSALEYTTLARTISTSGSVVVRHSDYVSNLVPKTTYYFQIVADNINGRTYGATVSFVAGSYGNQSSSGGTSGSSGTSGGSGTLTASPLVSTEMPSSIGQSSATFTGIANPQGSATQVWFEYGKTQSFGATIGHQSVGSGNTAIRFEYPLINLQPNTTYYYRAVAQGGGNQTVFGNIVSFSTQNFANAEMPTVQTKAVSVIHQNVAVLPASINPKGAFTHSWFEWGTSEALGTMTDKQPRGDGSVTQDYILVLSGLDANTKYFYRASAENAKGRTNGEILYFTTRPMPPAPPPPPIASAGASQKPAPSAPAPAPTPAITEYKGPILSLTASIKPTDPTSGGSLTYTLDYKNNSDDPLFDLTLRVIVPVEARFTGASRAVASITANTYTFWVGTVAPGGTGSITVEAGIGSVPDKTVIIFSGSAEYLTPSAVFKRADVYTGVTVGGGTTFSLSALAVGAASRIWLALAVFVSVLLVIFITWRNMRKRKKLLNNQMPAPPFGLPIQ